MRVYILGIIFFFIIFGLWANSFVKKREPLSRIKADIIGYIEDGIIRTTHIISALSARIQGDTIRVRTVIEGADSRDGLEKLRERCSKNCKTLEEIELLLKRL